MRITEWPDEAKNPFGEVVDVLGKAGDNNTEMHAILAEYGLPYTYPASVEAAAEKLPAEITPEDYAEREDFRTVTTFTIDPKDAKDFDDALSIRPLKPGLWEVGVHIADVSHYVKEGGAIDKEAVKRATSVYLVDRTIPMLPERLCNFICSLRPNEEKLAYSVIFTLNDNAEVKDYRIRHTVIKSDRRFTYEEAQAIIETGTGDYTAGSIDFDRVEVKFEIDEKGKPLSVYFKQSKEANKLIEEFMLLANRTVAEHIGKVPKNKKPKVFPYRIHDLPDPMKLENLNQFIARFGYKIRTGGSKTEVSRSLNRLLSDVSGKKEQNLIETVSLRAMQKARYSIHNILHLAHPPLSRPDGAPPPHPLRSRRAHRPSRQVRGIVRAQLCHGADRGKRRTRLREVQASRVYGRTHRQRVRRCHLGRHRMGHLRGNQREQVRRHGADARPGR